MDARICPHTYEKVYEAYDFNYRIENEGLFKITGSHMHYKSDDISEAVRCLYRPL